MEKQTIEILEYIDDKDTKFIMSTQDNLECDFDILPHDFLKYAEYDLSHDYEHNIINALSNSKRALDCQVDSLLLAFGFYNKSQEKFWGFPTKLEIVQKIGLIAPRILNKINKQRNLLEHQFIKPTKEQVEDMLDISMLFIASTDRYVLKFVPYVEIKNARLKNKYSIIMDYKNSKIVFKEYNINETPSLGFISDNEEKVQPKRSLEWKQGDSDYIEMIKKYLEIIK